MGLFDSIQDAAFNVVALTFGNIATWMPAAGGPALNANVLYKDATEKYGLSNLDFVTERYTMEYKAGDFVGLKQSVEAGTNEKVRITIGVTVLEFYVKAIETKFDGKTIVAFLNIPTIIS